MAFEFEVGARRGAARVGRLTTAHGVIDTPAFMPVGTLGAVKGLLAESLEDCGAQVQLANLYHLSLRPGLDRVAELGGIHAFTGWRGPMLTDSGGYQIFSLRHRRQWTSEGVTFRSHIDGSELTMTPEGVVRGQHRIGVDLAMVLDECAPWPIEKDGAAAAVSRTTEWARRSRRAWTDLGEPQARGLFGIVQGGVFEDLRVEAAEALRELDFDGYAIGGVSVGEPDEERRRAVELTAPRLPEHRPRYLMGVGTPEDIFHAVEQGIDLFDCVLPTRNARHALVYTRHGVLKLKNAAYREDRRPIQEDCSCPTCRRHSRAFLHHLFRSGEITAGVLATVHNLCFYLDFMQDLREAIASGRPASFPPTREAEGALE